MFFKLKLGNMKRRCGIAVFKDLKLNSIVNSVIIMLMVNLIELKSI